MILPDSASIFTAEIWTIIKALEKIKHSIASKYIIFTDSLSCLQALLYMNLEHPLIGMVIRKCVFLTFGNKDIIFSWVFLVICTEKADFAAKSTQELHRVEVGKSYTDFKHHINQYILFTSQVACIGAVANRLHYVEPVLGDWQSSLTRCGKDDIFLFLDRIILI